GISEDRASAVRACVLDSGRARFHDAIGPAAGEGVQLTVAPWIHVCEFDCPSGARGRALPFEIGARTSAPPRRGSTVRHRSILPCAIAIRSIGDTPRDLRLTRPPCTHPLRRQKLVRANLQTFRAEEHACRPHWARTTTANRRSACSSSPVA